MQLVRLATLALAPAPTIAAQGQNYKLLNNKNIIEVPSDFFTQSRGGYLLTTGAPLASTPGVLRFTVSGAFNDLHPFSGEYTNHSGINPTGGLTLGTDGRFYGVTYYGGKYNVGTVFQMTPDGITRTLHVFTAGDNGGCPFFAPLLSMSGDFYGTTEGGCSGGSSIGQSSSIIYRISAETETSRYFKTSLLQAKTKLLGLSYKRRTNGFMEP